MSDLSHPVYIPSKGRAHKCATAALLQQEGLPFYLVVEPQELEEYGRAFPDASFLALDRSDAGIWYARQRIMDHARAAGHAFHWQLDDDLRRFNEWNRPATALAALSFAGTFPERFQRIGMVSFALSQFAFAAKQEFRPYGRAFNAVLINTQTGHNYPDSWEYGAKEDAWLQVHMLRAGWATPIITRYSMEMKTPDGAGSGGCQDNLYALNRHVATAHNMHRLWPDFTLIVRKKSAMGTDVRINWKAISPPLVERQ